MARSNYKEVSWIKVRVLGKECLFTDERVNRNSIPKDYHMYEVRHDDNSWGDPVEIGECILVNFYGTLLTKEPFILTPAPSVPNSYLEIDIEKDWNYVGQDWIFGAELFL